MCTAELRDFLEPFLFVLLPSLSPHIAVSVRFCTFVHLCPFELIFLSLLFLFVKVYIFFMLFSFTLSMVLLFLDSYVGFSLFLNCDVLLCLQLLLRSYILDSQISLSPTGSRGPQGREGGPASPDGGAAGAGLGGRASREARRARVHQEVGCCGHRGRSRDQPHPG